MNKKLGKLLGKVFAKQKAKSDLGLGACCLRWIGTAGEFCLENYTQSQCAWLEGEFFPGKNCSEVCPSTSSEDLRDYDLPPEDETKPIFDESETYVDTVPTDPDAGGGGGGGGGGPVPCPSTPISIPNDCEREASEAAMCLEILQTGNTADQPTAKLLRGLVIGWGRYRCPGLKALCYHAENGNVGCYPDLTLTDMNCFCRIHNEYWKGLKRIVEEFCAGSLDGDTVRKRLTALCKQQKLARSRCQGNDGLPKDPIGDADNTGSLNCGIKRVD